MTDAGNGWEEVERPPLPEIFDVREFPLTGVYVETRAVRVRDNFGSSPDGKRDTVVHVFHFGESTAGKLVSVFGKPDLDGKLEQVKAGDVCRITYLGLEDLEGGKQLSKFSVQRKAGLGEPRPGQQFTTDDVATDDIPF